MALVENGIKATAALARCGCEYSNGAIAVDNNSTTVLTFDTAAVDTDSFYSAGKFTVPAGKAGVYAVTWQADWAADADGVRAIDVRVNGNVYKNSINRLDGSAAITPSQVVTFVGALAAGDYVEATAFHVAGAALNCTPKFRMYRMST